MKPAFQKDDALLEDIRTTRESHPDALATWWLGQSGFLVCWREHAVLFDPYLSDSLTEKYRETDKPHTRMTERVIDPVKLTGIELVTSSHNHTGLKLIPLGGVSLKNMRDYLAQPLVAAIGGSWLVDKTLVAAKDWAGISKGAEEAVAFAKA